jgi:tRNA threonylcarbamoyladenosine biosynthesis protein TsaB
LLESSSDLCSAALFRAGEIVIERTISEKNSHSKFLAPMVQELLRESKLDISDIDAVAISAGPGSYTGLRIGSSLAKGLCYSQEIPLIAVSSLDAIYQSAKTMYNQESICVLIDARRMDVYTRFYTKNAEPTVEEFCTLSEEFHYKELEEGKVVFAGSGSEKLKDLVKHSNATFVSIYAEAKDLATIANDKWKKQEFEDVAYFEPNYIKAVHITATKKTNFN